MLYQNAIQLRRTKEQAVEREPQAWNWLRGGTGDLFAPYYLDHRSDLPGQYRAVGWVGERLYTLIFEVREDREGEYYRLVTLWKATKEEQQLYEKHS